MIIGIYLIYCNNSGYAFFKLGYIRLSLIFENKYMFNDRLDINSTGLVMNFLLHFISYIAKKTMVDKPTVKKLLYPPMNPQLNVDLYLNTYEAIASNEAINNIINRLLILLIFGRYSFI